MQKRIKVEEEMGKGYDTKELLRQVVHLQALYRPVDMKNIIEMEKVNLRKTLEQIESGDGIMVSGVSSQKMKELERGNYILDLRDYDAQIIIPSLKDAAKQVLEHLYVKYPEDYDNFGNIIVPYRTDLDRLYLPNPFSLLFYGFEIKKIEAMFYELSSLYLKGNMPSYFVECRLIEPNTNVTYSSWSEIPFAGYKKEPTVYLRHEFQLVTALDDLSILESWATIQGVTIKEDKRWYVPNMEMHIQVRTVHLLHYFSLMASSK